MTDLDDAWTELRAATPTGWYVGRPSYNEGWREWSIYANDPTERAVPGKRTREWRAVAPTELGVLRDMARCLRILGEGGVPP